MPRGEEKKVPHFTPSACWGASLPSAPVTGSLEPQEGIPHGPDV